MSMSSMSSPSSAVFSPEPLSPSDHLCYVQCNFCETILAEELRDAPSNMNMMMMNQHPNMNDIPSFMNIHQHEITKAPPVNRPPEKRQRVPSAYNRFIKEEIQRIKAGNPDISHREAFSAAAKNWAHFPHIHFGLAPDNQPVKKTNMPQQVNPNLSTDGENNMGMKEGLYAPAAHVGVAPY
ncbi:hypothetical protein YC2023_028779 [Brassica napus]